MAKVQIGIGPLFVTLHALFPERIDFGGRRTVLAGLYIAALILLLLSNTSDLAFAIYAPNMSEAPIVRQALKEAEVTVGLGVAQSFAAPWGRLGAVEVELLSDPQVSHRVTVEADRDGHPSGEPLLTFPLTGQANPGSLTIDGGGLVLDIGKTYWITVRPEEAERASGLKLSGSHNDPYRVGEMLRWEIHGGGYFNGWRVTDPRYLKGVGHWPSSYEERLRFETLLTGGREPR